MEPTKEKPWTIHSWEELRTALAEMKPRTKLFNLVKAEMIKRGHWKRLPRGINTKK